MIFRFYCYYCQYWHHDLYCRPYHYFYDYCYRCIFLMILNIIIIDKIVLLRLLKPLIKMLLIQQVMILLLFVFHFCYCKYKVMIILITIIIPICLFFNVYSAGYSASISRSVLAFLNLRHYTVMFI